MTKYGEVEAARNRFPRNAARETIGSDRQLAEALRERGRGRGGENRYEKSYPEISPPVKSLPDCPSRLDTARDFRRVTTLGKKQRKLISNTADRGVKAYTMFSAGIAASREQALML